MKPDPDAAIRAEFEAWCRDMLDPTPTFSRLPSGRYMRSNAELLWLGWLAAHRHYCAGAATEPGG